MPDILFKMVVQVKILNKKWSAGALKNKIKIHNPASAVAAGGFSRSSVHFQLLQSVAALVRCRILDIPAHEPFTS